MDNSPAERNATMIRHDLARKALANKLGIDTTPSPEPLQALSQMMPSYSNTTPPLARASDITDGFQKGYVGDDPEAPKKDLIGGALGAVTPMLKYLNTSSGLQLLSGLPSDVDLRGGLLDQSEIRRAEEQRDELSRQKDKRSLADQLFKMVDDQKRRAFQREQQTTKQSDVMGLQTAKQAGAMDVQELKGLQSAEAAQLKASKSGKATNQRQMEALKLADKMLDQLSDYGKKIAGGGPQFLNVATNKASLYTGGVDVAGFETIAILVSKQLATAFENGRLSDKDYKVYRKALPDLQDTHKQRSKKIEMLRDLIKSAGINNDDTYSRRSGVVIYGGGTSDETKTRLRFNPDTGEIE
jgi:hypothetical protein